MCPHDGGGTVYIESTEQGQSYYFLNGEFAGLVRNKFRMESLQKEKLFIMVFNLEIFHRFSLYAKAILNLSRTTLFVKL